MRTAIFGVGALGTVLGAYLNRSGLEVDLIHHNPATVKALNEKGARVVGTVRFVQKVKALTPEEMTGKYDIIILLTKTRENTSIAGFLKDYLADDGVIVTLQNGLPEQGIASVVGEDKVLGCTVAWGATLKEPGVSELTSSPDSLTFSLGTAFPDRPNPRLKDVKEILERMGPVTVEENFLGARWSKLLINSAFSGMSAVLGCTFGEAAGPMRSRKIVLALIKECIDVCKAGGIRIEPVQGKDAAKLLDYSNGLKKAVSLFILPIAIRKHALLRASMLQDLEKGKKTEVDGINGAISAYGRKVGCPTPMNDKVVSIVHAIEDGKLKPEFGNLELFYS